MHLESEQEGNMYDDLKGKVAIVTGAGRPNGLGQGMAKRFAGEGCHLVISDVARPHADPEYVRGSWEELLERQKEIEALGARCLPVKCDVTVEEEVQAMVDAAIEEFGRVDILVNNVGVRPPRQRRSAPRRGWGELGRGHGRQRRRAPTSAPGPWPCG